MYLGLCRSSPRAGLSRPVTRASWPSWSVIGMVIRSRNRSITFPVRAWLAASMCSEAGGLDVYVLVGQSGHPAGSRDRWH